jgi:hypothetical protein
MVMDKADDHQGDATHMALFLDWALDRGLVDRGKFLEGPAWLRWLYQSGLISTRTFFLWMWDGALAAEDFCTGEGLEFAASYYENYLDDYGALFSQYPAYRVPYSKTTRAAAADMLDQRLQEWRSREGR